MLLSAKIYTRELTDKVTNRKFNVHKAILLNNTEDDLRYADIKFFIKRELVDKNMKEVADGFFNINVSKVVKKEYTTKNNEKAIQYIIHVDEMDEMLLTDSFRDKFNRIMEERNAKTIAELLD